MSAGRAGGDQSRRPRWRRLALLPATLLGLTSCTPPPAPALTPSAAALPSVDAALAMLEQLPEHGQDYYVADYPYQRAYFGEAWADADANGRGTRDDILAAQLTDVVLDRNGDVATGNFIDPYTGRVTEYVRGREERDPVVVDHVVSLWEAWAAGAWAWSPEERLDFANDPLNLVATTYAINEEKGPQNAARWHPATAQQECEFVLRVVAVKSRYQLEVTDRDRDYLRTALGNCR